MDDRKLKEELHEGQGKIEVVLSRNEVAFALPLSAEVKVERGRRSSRGPSAKTASHGRHA